MNPSAVLVVGGGATGAGIARDLALRGADVTLVDRDGLGSGTSGRSHGLLHSGARYAESNARDAEECMTENRVLREIAGACIRETGGLFVQVDGDDPAYFEEKREACEAAGIPTEVLDADTATDAVPGLADDVERVMRVPDGVISPSRLVAANAADARDHGATVAVDAPVEEMTREDGQITSVELGGSVGERIEPEYVVNATGAWAGQVADMVGLEVEMRPTRGVMVSVEYARLGPVLNRCRPPDDGDIIVPHEDEAVLGTTSVEVDDPDDYPNEDWEVERTYRECAAMLPAVADAPEVRTWWGVRPLYEPDESDSDGRGISRGFFLLDHAQDGVENFASVVGGKLTTYREMAEKTTDHVCDHLNIDAECRTADRQLPAVDDPDRLDALVSEFDGQNPTDADLIEVGP
jgi:glycerol-3-phosphate dehydrogenase